MGRQQRPEEFKFENPFKRGLYTDMPCLVCQKPIDVRYASNGFIHKPDCEKAASTGKVVYPTPEAEAVDLNSDGEEYVLEPEKLIEALVDPEFEREISS